MFNTTEPHNLITDETLDKILEKAHRLLYGDLLIDFLKLFIIAFKTHTHATSGTIPVVDDNLQKLITKSTDDELEKLLSKSIRCN